MRDPGFAPLGQNAVIVRITFYDSKCPRGTLTGPSLGKPVPFSSLTQLLLTLEELMDRRNVPQRGEERRAFVESRPSPIAEEALEPAETLATFQIRVLFRQNASWQGSLVWVEQNMEAQFRSVLELIRLMDSALSAEKESDIGV